MRRELVSPVDQSTLVTVAHPAQETGPRRSWSIAIGCIPHPEALAGKDHSTHRGEQLEETLDRFRNSRRIEGAELRPVVKARNDVVAAQRVANFQSVGHCQPWLLKRRGDHFLVEVLAMRSDSQQELALACHKVIRARPSAAFQNGQIGDGPEPLPKEQADLVDAGNHCLEPRTTAFLSRPLRTDGTRT